MIDPKIQFEAQGVSKDAIEHRVIEAALAVLPGCLERAGYAYDEHGKLLFRKLWDRGLAIDDAFEIGHAFVRASGFVVEEDASDTKPVDMDKAVKTAIALVRAAGYHVS